MSANDLPLDRSLDQNAKFHAMLQDIAKQVKWDGEYRDRDWWKFIVLGAAYGQQFVKNPFGGDPVCTNKRRSRDLEMPTMADLITQLDAFGSDKGVQWSDPEWKAMMADAEGRN